MPEALVLAKKFRSATNRDEIGYGYLTLTVGVAQTVTTYVRLGGFPGETPLTESTRAAYDPRPPLMTNRRH